MTARQIYEGVLIEMNKVQAPSLLLEDFNYLFNKAINQYINKRYNIYDVNQQTTDDLRVLKATAILKPKKSDIYKSDYGIVTTPNSLYGGTYEVNLPVDYLHILNCVCNYKVAKQFKCYDKDTYVQFAATRLTSDLWSQIINNFYMKPSYKRPYYFIHNTNTRNESGLPTNPYDYTNIQNTGFGPGTDASLITLNELFEQLKKELEGYTIEVRTDYTSAYVNNTTFTPEKGTYYVAIKNGVTYCILYNVVNKHFELQEETTTNIEIEGENIVVVTTGTNIKVIDETIYINNKVTGANYVLVTTDLLNRYGNSTTFAGLPRVLHTNYGDLDLVEKNAVHRYGNASNVRLEVRFGKDDSLFQLDSIYVDYIKTPQFIRLTQEQIDKIEDTSQVMEFPDYVCQEIINELTHLLMENSSDQRLQTHIPVSQSIANPAQAQAQ